MKILGNQLSFVLALILCWSFANAEETRHNKFILDYETTSTQDTRPYVFAGRLVDRDHPRWNDFERALERFPNTQSCLLEQSATMLDLSKVDWRKPQNLVELEICVFRIAASLKSPEDVSSWMVSQDLEVQPWRDLYSDEIAAEQDALRYVSGISGNWTFEQFREKRPYWLYSLTGFSIGKTVSVVVQYSNENQVVGARVTPISK